MSWRNLLDWRRNKGDKISDKPRKRGLLGSWAAVSIVGLMILLAVSAAAQKKVLIVADGKEIGTRTFAGTVGGVLDANKIVLLDSDEIVPAADTPLQSGMVVTVNRAFDVSICIDGEILPVRSRSLAVGDLLKEKGVQLGPEDEIKPAGDTEVVQGMNILVSRIHTETEIKDAALGFETIRKYTVDLPQGVTRVAEEGTAGTEQQTWNIKYSDGVEVGRQLVASKTISPAADEVILIGSGQVVSRGGEDIRYSEAVDMVASAYSYTGYNTSSGVAPYYGAVAVDTDYIPLGTEMYVEGYGYATALDRGSSIVGDRIDLFFESHDEAMSWGIRDVKVYIID
jgi:uncharacterized protein YabE (DUF348 family)